MGGRSGLGEFEQLLLLAVVRLGDQAYGPEIAAELEQSVGRSVTRGALYSTLNRLEHKGLLTWEPAGGADAGSGAARRLFDVTPKGVAALRERREALLTMWDGIEHVIGGSS